MPNDYYDSSGTPATGSFGASAPMRAQFTAIEQGFDRLAPLTAGKAVVINGLGTAQDVTTGNFALAGDFATVGGHALTLTTVGAVALQMPAVSGTLATLAGTETLSNKTLTTPILGVATATSINKVTITAPASTATLTIDEGKTLRATATLTLSGTDATVMTFPATSATVAGLGIAQTFTALQTITTASFTGSATVLAAIAKNIKEPGTRSATAATGTINYDIATQSILQYTSSAAANWTVNFRHSSSATLDSVMSVGDFITCAFMVAQGATPYYNNVIQVDGTPVTPVYIGQSAWSSGSANARDLYSYTIVKTASATFEVWASQVRCA